jgi:hypothetical protein
MRALALGLAIGPAPVVADAGDLEPTDMEESPAGESFGYAVDGAHFHVWDEDAREASDWGVELIRAERPYDEVARWREIAVRSAVFPTVGIDALEAELALDGEEPEERGVSALGGVLCLLPSLDRTVLITSWATSPDTGTRRALARALSAPFEAVGVRGALERLGADPDPEVRRLASAAAAVRDGSLA